MRGWLSLMFMGLLFITGAVGMMSLLALWWSYMQVAHAFCGVLLGTIIALYFPFGAILVPLLPLHWYALDR